LKKYHIIIINYVGILLIEYDRSTVLSGSKYTTANWSAVHFVWTRQSDKWILILKWLGVGT